MTEPTDPLQWRHIAEVLSLMPDVYKRLKTTHIPCDNGMCRACTEGGTGAHLTPWPCSLHKLATLAQKIRDQHLRGRPG